MKVKLDDALRSKVDRIDEKRQLEVAEIKKLEQMTKQQKERHEKNKTRGNVEKKNKKTLFQEERDVHEAYQLLLSEHTMRVKQRLRQKIANIGSIAKKDNGQASPSTRDKPKVTVDTTIKAWQNNAKPTKSSKSNGIYSLFLL